MSDLHQAPKILKQDLFGRVELIYFSDSSAIPQLAIRRDFNSARWWARPLATYLARREIKALTRLEECDASESRFPRIISHNSQQIVRSYISGVPLHIYGKPQPQFFEQLKELLTQMHAAKVTHNDLAKEPNIIVTDDGRPALIDMQLASCATLVSPLFNTQCREDFRHILKHQRTYYPSTLTDNDLILLAKRSIPAKIWMTCVKPIYLLITRRIFNWSDREGAGDRGAN
ncbi:MAG: serine/threonine protein kinase [Planctomycetota bacterium]|nr:serine/threonine protein kinase [Planctomycetota bacterium]